MRKLVESVMNNGGLRSLPIAKEWLEKHKGRNGDQNSNKNWNSNKKLKLKLQKAHQALCDSGHDVNDSSKDEEQPPKGGDMQERTTPVIGKQAMGTLWWTTSSAGVTLIHMVNVHHNLFVSIGHFVLPHAFTATNMFICLLSQNPPSENTTPFQHHVHE